MCEAGDHQNNCQALLTVFLSNMTVAPVSLFTQLAVQLAGLSAQCWCLCY